MCARFLAISNTIKYILLTENIYFKKTFTNFTNPITVLNMKI